MRLSIARPPFAYSDDDVTTMKAHWTKAAAMAMKCRVLPVCCFSIVQRRPAILQRQVFHGECESGQVWLGWVAGEPELSAAVQEACEDFFNENANNGNPYHLVEPTTQDY